MSLFFPIYIHPEGWRFIGIFALVSLVLFYVAQPLGWIGFVLTLWCAYFFRNPKRITPNQKGLIVSPADGIVCGIKKMVPPKEFGMGNTPHFRISVFLNVFDVHVNRVPMAGKIVKSIYHAGHFFNAADEKASDHNERQVLVIEDSEKVKIGVVQIAGLIARRILCEVTEGDKVETGSVYGLIRFGSRMDIYFPENTWPLVIEGQRVIGGETVLADVANGKTAQKSLREGVSH